MAIKFEKIKAGMTLWDVKKATGLERYRGSKWLIWPVYIKKVDPETRRVLVSWNNNPEKWWHEKTATKLRAKKPQNG
jgi:hypothetical protein